MQNTIKYTIDPTLDTEGFSKESLRSEDRRSSTLSTEDALRDSRLSSFGAPTMSLRGSEKPSLINFFNLGF